MHACTLRNPVQRGMLAARSRALFLSIHGWCRIVQVDACCVLCMHTGCISQRLPWLACLLADDWRPALKSDPARV
jgi:hypothetical protein